MKNIIRKNVSMLAIACMLSLTGFHAPQQAQAAGLTDTVKSTVQKAMNAILQLLDIGDHWAKSAIETAIQKGYVDGYEDQTFRPDQQLTRAEFAKMIVTALKIPVSAPANGDSWYSPYINAAVNHHIHAWSDFTNGDWNTPITRIEMARMAIRAADKTYQQADKMTIPDSQVMYLATKAGLIQGMDDTGLLGEDQPTTRAQSVTIIERILTFAAGGKLPADKHAVSRAEVEWHGTNIFTMLPRYFPADQMNKFDISQFHWNAADGIYHEKVLEYIAVDMEDPNDPFRGEIEDIPVRYWKQDDPNAVYFDKLPVKSIVTYSKVEMTLNGPYPEVMSRDTITGGGISVEPIVPADGIASIPNSKYELYEKLNTPQQLYRTIHITGTPVVKWNARKFNQPLRTADVSNEGGTLYWIAAEAHPKGDFFSSGNGTLLLSYTPEITYLINLGPNIGTGTSLSIRFNTDYTQHN